MRNALCLTLILFSYDCAFAQPKGPDKNDLVPAGEGLLAPPGFKVSLVACEPLVVNPAAMCVAPDGRIFVCEEYVHAEIPGARRDVVKVLVGAEKGGEAREAIELTSDLNSVQGLAFHDGKLYIAHSPNISVLPISVDKKPGKLSDLVTGVGAGPKGFSPTHQASGLLIRDGKLYICFGDQGCDVKTKEGGRIKLDTGGILRCDLDGSKLEVYAHGFRNIYGLAMDPLGNAFTRENDNDGGGYNCRSYHIIKGGYYGWPFRYREADAATAPDVLPLAQDQGHGSSTDCLYLVNPKFPAPFNDGVLFGDWTKAKVLFSKPVAKGATFDLPERPFLADQLAKGARYQFRPTAIQLATDGSLLVADMGTLWLHSRDRRGRVLRVTYTGNEAASVKLPIGADLNATTATPDLIGKLTSADASERARAALLLGERGAKEAAPHLTKLLNDPDPLVRLRTATALGDLRDTASTPHLVQSLSTEKDRWVQFAFVGALRTIQDFAGLSSALDKATSTTQLDLLYAARDVRDPKAIDLLVAVATGKATAEIRAKATEFLGVVAKRGWHIRGGNPVPREPVPTESWAETPRILQTLYQLVRDPEPRVQEAALTQLQRMQDKTVVDTILADLKAGQVKLNDSTALILVRSAGGEKAETVLVEYLKSPGKPETRLEVVRLLTVTSSPESLAAIRDVAFRADSGWELKAAAVDALARRGDGESVPQLLELLKVGPPELQRASARALGLIVSKAEKPAPDVRTALEAAAESKDRPLQVQAVIALWRLGGAAAKESALPRILAIPPSDDAIQLEILEAVSAKIQDREEPLMLLWIEHGTLGQSARSAAIGRLRKWAKTDFGLPGAFGTKRQEAIDKVAAYRKEKYPGWTLPAMTALPKIVDESVRLAKLAEETLTAKGDPTRGSAIFRNKATTNCIACHKAGGDGGAVGPDLTEIGAKYPRAALIESVLFPSKQIQPGYETSVLQLDSGETVTGIIREETTSRLTVVLGDGSVKVVSAKEIEARRRTSTSAMPAGLANSLTPEEFADLIAFLESLRSAKK